MTVAGGEAITFAASEKPEALHALVSNWLALGEAPLLRTDACAGLHQSASLAGGRLQVLLWTGGALDRGALNWAIDLLGREAIDPPVRRFVLAGRAPGGCAAASPLVCACFGVRRDAIETAIARGRHSVDAIGEATRAGGNCGSCRSEIQQILTSHAVGGR
jgi:assimilatory nitrate reductase catalytic subunit